MEKITKNKLKRACRQSFYRTVPPLLGWFYYLSVFILETNINDFKDCLNYVPWLVLLLASRILMMYQPFNDYQKPARNEFEKYEKKAKLKKAILTECGLNFIAVYTFFYDWILWRFAKFIASNILWAYVTAIPVFLFMTLGFVYAAILHITCGAETMDCEFLSSDVYYEEMDKEYAYATMHEKSASVGTILNIFLILTLPLWGWIYWIIRTARRVIKFKKLNKKDRQVCVK